MDAKELTYHLGGKWIGNRGSALCPAHREKTPSLSISDGSGRSGPIVLVKCFGGCDQEDVLDALNVLGLKITTSSGTFEKRNVSRKRTKPKKEEIPEQSFDFSKQLSDWYRDTSVKDLTLFANSIGVHRISLAAIKSVRIEKGLWAFPMRNSDGYVIGIRTRKDSGEKKAIYGSRSGLIYPIDFPEKQTVWICEGPTDTAAAISLGLCAVGRPSCNSCVEMTVNFLKRVRALKAVVVSDNDSPGKKGADAMQKALKIPSVMWIPPSKDIREFLKNGGDHDTATDLVKNLNWTIPK